MMQFIRIQNVIGIVVLALVSVSNARAQQPLPEVRPPSLFDEGTQTGLTPAQGRELLPWSFDAQTELKETVASLARQAPGEQLASLERDLARIVARTEGSRAALLMRYVINRGLKLSDVMAEEVSFGPGAGWILDQRVRLLRRSAEFALKYAERDVQYLREGKVLPPYASFGAEYARFLMDLGQSVLDASAQYRVTRLALGLLAWDLYQDERRLAHAPAIVRLQNELERQPERVPPGEVDAKLVARVRSLKAAYLRAIDALGSGRDALASRSSEMVVSVADVIQAPNTLLADVKDALPDDGACRIRYVNGDRRAGGGYHVYAGKAWTHSEGFLTVEDALTHLKKVAGARGCASIAPERCDVIYREGERYAGGGYHLRIGRHDLEAYGYLTLADALPNLNRLTKAEVCFLGPLLTCSIEFISGDRQAGGGYRVRRNGKDLHSVGFLDLDDAGVFAASVRDAGLCAPL